MPFYRQPQHFRPSQFLKLHHLIKMSMFSCMKVRRIKRSSWLSFFTCKHNFLQVTLQLLTQYQNQPRSCRATPASLVSLFRNISTQITNSSSSLPSGIRRQVYGHLFPSESRRICLSPRSATKAAFPNGYFANPWDVLKNVMGGIGSSRALRQDLMTYFWSHYAFHVTINHFNGPYFCPLSEVGPKFTLLNKCSCYTDLAQEKSFPNPASHCRSRPY